VGGIRSVSAIAAVLGILAGACSSDSEESSETTTTTVVPTYSAEVERETEIAPLYRQGLARVDDGWVFSNSDGLFLTDDELTQTSFVRPGIPDDWVSRGFDHIGDIDVVDDVVYAPLEQPNYELGEQAMVTYDAATLAYRDGLSIAQHEASFVTVDPETHVAYSMDRFGGDALLRYDVDDEWRPLDPLQMSTRVERVQGGDIADGAVWLSTDDSTDGVYRVDLETGEVQSLGSIGHVDGEGEGIDATTTPAGDLHVISLDAAVLPVRLIDLEVATTP
jgi:hypothetical protein